MNGNNNLKLRKGGLGGVDFHERVWIVRNVALVHRRRRLTIFRYNKNYGWVVRLDACLEILSEISCSCKFFLQNISLVFPPSGLSNSGFRLEHSKLHLEVWN